MPELSRRVRNSLEHYDDRMDRWLAADDGTVYATGVGSPDSVGDGTQGFMRGFYSGYDDRLRAGRLDLITGTDGGCGGVLCLTARNSGCKPTLLTGHCPIFHS